MCVRVCARKDTAGPQLGRTQRALRAPELRRTARVPNGRVFCPVGLPHLPEANSEKCSSCADDCRARRLAVNQRHQLGRCGRPVQELFLQLVKVAASAC